VEKSWTNFKYSVNNEETKYNDETIIRDNAKNGQLVTLLQINNCDTLKISESTTCANSSEQPQQPQLAAKIATNTEQNRASKSAANEGKSIIPARRLCLSNCLNGSLVKTNSNKELGTPDNTSRNTIYKQGYNLYTNIYHNLNNSNPNLKKLKTLHKIYNPYIFNDVKDITQTQHVRNYKPLIYDQTFEFIYPYSRTSILLQ